MHFQKRMVNHTKRLCRYCNICELEYLRSEGYEALKQSILDASKFLKDIPSEVVTSSSADRRLAYEAVFAKQQKMEVDGVIVDYYTSSIVVQIARLLSPDNREKFFSGPIDAIGIRAFNLMQKVA